MTKMVMARFKGTGSLISLAGSDSDILNSDCLYQSVNDLSRQVKLRMLNERNLDLRYSRLQEDIRWARGLDPN